MKTITRVKSMEALTGIELEYIDMTYLEEMSDGCYEFISEVSKVFLEQMPQLTIQLHECWDKKDFKALCSTVHKAKSAINIMGIEPLAQYIAQFEKKNDSNNNSDTLKFIESFDKISSLAIIEVKNILICIEKYNQHVTN